MDPPPTPIPLLPYARQIGLPRGGRFRIAAQTAGWFAGFCLIISVVGSTAILLITTAGKDLRDLRYALPFFWTIFFLITTSTFIISLFGCWIRLAITRDTLAKRRLIWLFALIHVGIPSALFFPHNQEEHFARAGYFDEAACLWLLIIPFFSCFFLLRRTNM